MKGLDPSRPLSLYIHVPFCTRKCDYCAFYSIPLSTAEPGWIDRYVSVILAEIGALSKEWGKPFHTVFIGGGNPGVLGYGNLRRILEKAEENGMPEEVTAEINPENVTPELRELSDVLTRVSVGIQSMDDEVLRRLGRNASREDNIRALELLSSMPFRWNADIITAVPGESIGRTLKDIEEVASYNPGHISFYCLTFEEGTPLIARETPVGEEEDSVLSDFIEDKDAENPANQTEFVLLQDKIRDLLSTLPQREQEVLRMRFGLDDGYALTLEEVGLYFDVTRERIRQIEAKALRRLRHPKRSRQLKDWN